MIKLKSVDSAQKIDSVLRFTKGKSMSSKCLKMTKHHAHFDML